MTLNEVMEWSESDDIKILNLSAIFVPFESLCINCYDDEIDPNYRSPSR